MGLGFGRLGEPRRTGGRSVWEPQRTGGHRGRRGRRKGAQRKSNSEERLGRGEGETNFCSELILELPCKYYLFANQFVIYFIAASHYIIDGIIWRRTHNHAMPRVIDRLAGIALEPAARLRRVV